MGPLHDSMFVGLKIRRLRSERHIYLSQERYAGSIVSRFGLSEGNECSTPMDIKQDWTCKEDDVYLDSTVK